MKMKDNQVLVTLILKLLKSEKPIWKKVAYELQKPRRSRIEVNTSKLETLAKQSGTVIVPGKVLGSGAISKKMTVAAFSFSGSARKLIENAGGKTISIDALHQSNPSGKDVMILK